MGLFKAKGLSLSWRWVLVMFLIALVVPGAVSFSVVKNHLEKHRVDETPQVTSSPTKLDFEDPLVEKREPSSTKRTRRNR